MKYKERFDKAKERIAQIRDDSYDDYTQVVSGFLCRVCDAAIAAESGEWFDCSVDELKQKQDKLYHLLLPEYYEHSYLYPPYAKQRLGEELGAVCSALFADLTASICYGIRGEWHRLVLLLELFVKCYLDVMSLDSEEEKTAGIKRAMRSFYMNETANFTDHGILSMIKPDSDTVYARLCDPAGAEPSLQDLFRYGCYIGENELAMAEHLAGLSQDAVAEMAKTYVDGYIRGFETTGKNIKIKNTVNIEYPIGMERVVRKAISLFKEQGLEATFVPEAILSVTGRGGGKRGVYATSVNRRFDFDHKDDRGLYMDKEFNDIILYSMRECFKANKSAAFCHGGPAVIELFGEKQFDPVPSDKNYTYTDDQNKENIRFAAAKAETTNKYIPGEDRSYTIISYPVPEIGESFSEIFNETVKVNTLDYELYRDIQQKLIDTLDKGRCVRVKGAGSNSTDITVMLHELSDPSSQTNFENCVADVNIPVGEVFTSPVLEGTDGRLFVSRVYLNGYEYKKLCLDFKDGMIADYSCENFEDRQQCRRFIEDNLLYHHSTLPIGEFAIGTNTTAYRMARDYNIESKLSILIMEKTGPHFAVGDTCYSYEEDSPMYNPDGKECIARDNSCSIKRRLGDPKDREEAYFHCHTDITIPFEELSSITVVEEDGTETDIIRDGRFVLAGTEGLNKPLEGLI